MPKMAREPLVETHSYLLIAVLSMSQLLILLKSKQALDSKIPDSQDFGVFLPPFSQNWFKGFQGPVRTNAFPKVCVFVVIEKASINSRPHYRFDALSTVHTKTFENDRIARCDVSWTLRACCKHTRLWYFRSSFSFCSTVQTNTTRVRFRFDPLSTAFSNQCVFLWKCLAYKCGRKA